MKTIRDILAWWGTSLSHHDRDQLAIELDAREDALLDQHQTTVTKEIQAAVLAACDATEDAYAGQFREGETVDLGLIRAAVTPIQTPRIARQTGTTR